MIDDTLRLIELTQGRVAILWTPPTTSGSTSGRGSIKTAKMASKVTRHEGKRVEPL